MSIDGRFSKALSCNSQSAAISALSVPTGPIARRTAAGVLEKRMGHANNGHCTPEAVVPVIIRLRATVCGCCALSATLSTGAHAIFWRNSRVMISGRALSPAFTTVESVSLKLLPAMACAASFGSDSATTYPSAQWIRQMGCVQGKNGFQAVCVSHALTACIDRSTNCPRPVRSR